MSRRQNIRIQITNIHIARRKRIHVLMLLDWRQEAAGEMLSHRHQLHLAEQQWAPDEWWKLLMKRVKHEVRV